MGLHTSLEMRWPETVLPEADLMRSLWFMGRPPGVYHQARRLRNTRLARRTAPPTVPLTCFNCQRTPLPPARRPGVQEAACSRYGRPRASAGLPDALRELPNAFFVCPAPVFIIPTAVQRSPARFEASRAAIFLARRLFQRSRIGIQRSR